MRETAEWKERHLKPAPAKIFLVDFTSHRTSITHNAQASSRPGQASDLEAES